MRDPVLELPDFRLPQVVVEFGLAEERHLQQFVVFGVDIGQQPDFFQRGDRHALGFLDNHHHALALCVPLDQIILQGMHDHESGRVRCYRQMQFESDGVEDFPGGDARVGEVHCFYLVGKPCEQRVAQHGLAAADFTGDLDDAFAVTDGVDQCLEDGATVSAAEKKARVRRDLEGCLCQAEVFVIHGVTRLCRRRWLCRWPACGCRAWCG